MPDFRNAIFRVATNGTGPEVRAPAAYRRACLLEASYPLGVELSRCRQPRAAGASTKKRRSLFLLVDNAERKHSPTSRDSEAEAWLRAGKTIVLRERNQVIARIVPEKPERQRPVKYPDFAARARKIFGDRVLPGAKIVIEERGRY